MASLYYFVVDQIKDMFARPPLTLTAKPGLITLLDLALFRSVEGELTASISAVHALLQAWLDLKHQAQVIMKKYHHLISSSNSANTSNSLSRHALEAACDAIEKIATDRLAASANLSDAYEASATFSSSSHSLVGVTNTVDAEDDTGRRQPKIQRPRDCWETARLVCPDHVWSDDVFCTGQRHIRNLTKQLPTDGVWLPAASVSDFDEDSDDDDELDGMRYELMRLTTLIQQDLPLRLHQFRVATESNVAVLKRLYLIKCEYRAPFRAFLEAHQTVQRAPSLDLVMRYLGEGGKKPKANSEEGKSKDKGNALLQDLLETPELIEALELERTIEKFEGRLAKGLYGFTELARMLDYKKVRLTVVPGVVENIQPLQDLLQRLKRCLCRKVGPETSTGIRPIFFDLQGIPRDEDGPNSRHFIQTSVEDRVKTLVKQLQQLIVLCQTRHVLIDERKGDYFDVPSSVVKVCSKFDAELWEAQCLDWFDMVGRQKELSKNFNVLSEQIRKAEMETSIKAASPESLVLVKERLERLSLDRDLRFEVLQQMAEDVCLREMNWTIILKEPASDSVLTLPSTSCNGLVGRAMQMAGETLPIG